jgi:MscS family membrane protein
MAEPFADAAPTGAAATLREWIPESLRGGVLFGLETWQWLGLFLILLAGLLLDHLVRPFLRLAVKRLLAHFADEPTTEELRRTVRPWGWVVAGLLWLGGLHLLELPGLTQVVLVQAARVFLSLVSVWATWRAVDVVGGVLGRRALSTESKVDDVLVPLVKRAGKLFVAAMGVVYVADGLAIDIAPLLASLGLGGLAFAFAAKDTIENFFGSIAVITDRPFLVGDWVLIDDVEGTVERIGFRSTRIRTFYDSIVTVPNSTLVRAKVDNFGRRRYRRIKTMLQLSYATPPDTVSAFCEGVRELIRRHPATRKDYFQVWLKDLGASSLDVLLYCFVKTPDWSAELRERERLLLDILRLAEALGVEIAFPTQTLHLRQDEASGAGTTKLEDAGDAKDAGRAAARSVLERGQAG